MADENNNNTTVDPIEKHLDLAIEAQDGPKTTETTDDTTTTDTTQQNKETANEQKPDNKDSTSGDGNGTTQQNAEQKGTAQEKPVAGAKDLKDKDGNIIARGGPERRFYEQRELARQQLGNTQRELETTRGELARLRTEHEATVKSIETIRGLPPKDVEIGARVIGDLKRDPVGTLKKLLAETAAQGYDVSDLGVGIDASVMQRMLDERLPKNNTTEKSDEEIVREAEAEANQFFTNHSDARIHDALIANVMRDHPHLDLQGAYYQLKEAFIEKGFDWSRTLEDNLKDAQNGQTNQNGQQTPNNQQQTTEQQRELPNGRAQTDEVFKLDNGNAGHEDDDMGSIVRAAMRESGLKV